MKTGVYLIDYEQPDFDKDDKYKIHDKCIDALFNQDGSEIIVNQL